MLGVHQHSASPVLKLVATLQQAVLSAPAESGFATRAVGAPPDNDSQRPEVIVGQPLPLQECQPVCR